MAVASARQQRVLEITEMHERRLESLRDQMRAAEQEAAACTNDLGASSPYMVLQKRLFDAKFELNASRRSKEDLDKEGEKQQTKSHETMAALHTELRRTHDAMRD
jgi:hypothetical protein